MKRFRAEGGFLVRALVDLVVQCRSQIGRLESEFAELEKLAGEHELPRDVLQAMHHLAHRQRTLGLNEAQLCDRLNQLQELHILPEHRAQPDPDSEDDRESSGRAYRDHGHCAVRQRTLPNVNVDCLASNAQSSVASLTQLVS